MNESYLLDTCVLIWIARAAMFGRKAGAVLARAQHGECELAVSAMSAWEIGMLVSKGRLETPKTAMGWFEAVVEGVSARVLAASPAILVSSCFIPAPIHNDPMDRIIIATAREHDLTIITRDRAILAYGAAGHVKTLAC